MKEIMHPTWLDVNPLQETDSSTASITDFGRKDFTGKFTGAVIGRSVGTGMDFDPPSRETGTGTGSLLGWGIDNGMNTGFVKHFKDCGTGTDTDRKDQGIGTDTGTSSDSSNKVQDQATGIANLAGFLPPISESESESSLTRLPFKPRTFDDNLVNIIIVIFISITLTMIFDQAFYFQEVGPLEEEKSVEEIFVSGQKSAVEFGIDMQRR